MTIIDLIIVIITAVIFAFVVVACVPPFLKLMLWWYGAWLDNERY